MNDKTSNADAPWTQWLANPWGLAQAWADYTVDACQRAVLYADVERQVGDQYQAQLRKTAPNVLNFPGEVVMSGLDLPRPVNYGMARILPQPGQVIDDTKRPFVVVDPRAGHGPGIGGFKPDSEIGAALAAGHPCYFVGFLPNPVPGQTVEDVMRAEAAFLRRVAELHPDSQGKPAVIGNCQAGWQILMTAAVWPELFGPIIVAGTPVSYWGGDNPMRYAGGLMGGSWMTALTGDTGAGRFDGAWLVQNFENLDPANTLWTKQYHLYANIDTEGPRYIGFEKYWGGHVFLNDVEMQYIVDNLFIGNKLSTAQLITSDGIRIDLRNIKSPILVFCSHGDNITPPAQALGWITDLYRDDNEVIGHDQTIVYATHPSIGHLGIFVSGSVGRKEHRKFASTIDQIDLLPAGIYRATVDDVPEDAGDVNDPYLLSIHRSGVEDVRAIVRPDPESDRRFSAAARISEINLALYRSFVQPWVRAFSTPYTAAWLHKLHPLRLSFEAWTSDNPLAAAMGKLADDIREQRAPVPAGNPFLQLQQNISDAVVQALNQYRDRRDGIYAITFDTLFGSPWIQALAGQTYGDRTPVRTHPGASPEHRRFLQEAMQHLQTLLHEGGALEVSLRALFYVFQHHEKIDERYFHYASQLPDVGLTEGQDLASFRRLVRTQAVLLAAYGDQAIEPIPSLLKGTAPEVIEQISTSITQLAQIDGAPLTADAQTALERVQGLLAGAVDLENAVRMTAQANRIVRTSADAAAQHPTATPSAPSEPSAASETVDNKRPSSATSRRRLSK
ncbi:3-hydroxyalkanoate synthetase [Achromobacter pulmonis]|uniref:3-hydroxyalkanoate synthetase n=1 Tax=Achromobacter pulmonis TaxID=1389932 RepID=A0A2N8K9G2_9BURK|nr:DUF3141 domain-containing protein [Achromobacter pulmonis]MBO9332982.1 DUF3141 domain-containing protein [Achromobacter xylosoxidans]PND30092.1 3-hydroxyalkanoate synthetase [Achromobacter pulmonis]